MKKNFLHSAIFIAAFLPLLNQGSIKAAATTSTLEMPVTVEIRSGEVSETSKVIKIFQETDLTLILKSDQPLVLHLHGYDIIAKVQKFGKALMKLNTFATGRFPIKMHLLAEDHQGNAHHERTLLYLEVHPN